MELFVVLDDVVGDTLGYLTIDAIGKIIEVLVRIILQTLHYPLHLPNG
jgi:hypothetical protein